MNKFFSALFVFSLTAASLFLIQSCSKSTTAAPGACIGYITTPATVSGSVTFISCTVGASSYTWNFGDGTNASGDTAIHTYATAGTYQGSLTVILNGVTTTKAFTITVLPTGWTFKGGVYTIDSAIASLSASTLTAAGISDSGNATLSVRFFPYPTVGGSYTIISAQKGQSGPNQLYVVLSSTVGGVRTFYGSTGTDSLNAQVGVSAGKISVSLPSIEMANLSNPVDSSRLFATFTQTR